MAIATGQFTIIDYNDALTLTGYVTSNVRKTQIYNPDNGLYTPDWTQTPYLVLTPSLFKLGSSSDIITDAAVIDVKWYKVANGTETLITADSKHIYSGTKNQILTIKTNDVGTDPGIDFVCVVTYKDASTDLNLTTKIPISFSKTVSGGGITDAIAWAPNGNIFKNANSPTLTAQCTLWRGSLEDLTGVSYSWYINDVSVWATTLSANASSGATSLTLTSVAGVATGTSLKINGISGTYAITAVNTGTKVVTIGTGLASAASSGASVTKSTGDFNAGAGWTVLSDVANTVTGTTTHTITIYAALVLNVANFMCIIKDTDNTSTTYNQLFRDTIAITDQTDPYQVTITSTGGSVFKNGKGTTRLTAKIYQAGAEVDSSGTTYTYTWYIYNKDGVLTTFYGGSSTKTGKYIDITDTDVTVKSTFEVIVS